MSKYILMVMCLVLVGCSESREERVKRLKGKIIAAEFVTVNDLRRKFRERAVDNFKDSQLFGDSEVGVRGGADLYKLIQAEAYEYYPDGVYKQVSYYSCPHKDESILFENTRIYMESIGYTLLEHSTWRDIYKKE